MRNLIVLWATACTSMPGVEARDAAPLIEKGGEVSRMTAQERAHVEELVGDVAVLRREVDGLLAWKRAVSPSIDALSAELPPPGAELVARMTSSAIWTVGAGQDYPDLVAALHTLDELQLAPGVTLTLRVSGATAYGAPLVIQHPQGAQLHIVGDPAQPPTLSFAGSQGLLVSAGSVLAELSNVHIDGNGTSSRGISVSEGGRLLGGTEVRVTHFVGNCVEASTGAYISIDRLSVEHCAAGVLAGHGAVAVLPRLRASQTDIGAWADSGATLFVGNGSFDQNISHGVLATGRGRLDARESTFHETSGSLAADRGGYLDLTAAMGAVSALDVTVGSFADIEGATLTIAAPRTMTNDPSVLSAVHH